MSNYILCYQEKMIKFTTLNALIFHIFDSEEIYLTNFNIIHNSNDSSVEITDIVINSDTFKTEFSRQLRFLETLIGFRECEIEKLKEDIEDCKSIISSIAEEIENVKEEKKIFESKIKTLQELIKDK